MAGGHLAGDQLQEQLSRPLALGHVRLADGRQRRVCLASDAQVVKADDGELLKLMFAINRGGLGPFFYRMAAASVARVTRGGSQ